MSNSTSLTLLERLRSPSDQEAWSRFARLYTPLLYYWSRRVGLQEQDSADLVQDVFMTLVQKLPQFHYDRNKSFRNWLHVVMLNKWRERQRRKVLQPAVYSAGVVDVAAPSNEWGLEELEYRRELVHSALRIIEPEFSPLAWQAFMQHVVEGCKTAEVAVRLGIRIGTVYAAKCRVLNRLRQELQGFLDE
ncbi:MAG: RNA polymerase sigma factor [Planctomycetales bacterium]